MNKGSHSSLHCQYFSKAEEAFGNKEYEVWVPNFQRGWPCTCLLCAQIILMNSKGLFMCIKLSLWVKAFTRLGLGCKFDNDLKLIQQRKSRPSKKLRSVTVAKLNRYGQC